MSKTFPKFVKHISHQIQKVQEILIRINKIKFVLKHTVVKQYQRQRSYQAKVREKSGYLK